VHSHFTLLTVEVDLQKSRLTTPTFTLRICRSLHPQSCKHPQRDIQEGDYQLEPKEEDEDLEDHLLYPIVSSGEEEREETICTREERWGSRRREEQEDKCRT